MIADQACKALVYEYQKLAAQDIRFDVPLADACIDDRTKYCAHVAPVGLEFAGAASSLWRLDWSGPVVAQL
jgi:hypothetical protein